ncbi:MAG: hypothetical protein B7C24_06220, partial [Bacteroidetes bacterium 4572_77]
MQKIYLPAKEELHQLYEKDLKPALEGIEGERKSILIKYIISLAETYIIVFYLAIAVILGLGFFMLFVTKTQRVAYRKVYKTDVVKSIVNLINPDWKYEADGRISEMNYRSSQLFETRWDKYEGDDKVSGTIEKTDFHFSELHTQYKTVKTDSEGKTEESWHTI